MDASFIYKQNQKKYHLIIVKKKIEIYDIGELKKLFKSCIGGDSTSIMYFQELLGEDIYNFPVKVRREDKDKAADFYCYCFEKGRIFKRLLTYKGACKLRTFQYYVLNDLYNEWKRAESLHNLPMSSLNKPVNPDSGEEMIDFVKNYDPSYSMIFDIESISLSFFKNLLMQMSEEERIYIKLLTYWVLLWPMIYRNEREFSEVLMKGGFLPARIKVIYEPFRIHGIGICRK